MDPPTARHLPAIDAVAITPAPDARVKSLARERARRQTRRSAFAVFEPQHRPAAFAVRRITVSERAGAQAAQPSLRREPCLTSISPSTTAFVDWTVDRDGLVLRTWGRSTWLRENHTAEAPPRG